tara:strand:+ start:488 stop:664 length:177 start_codon:yes stop_codon:yes gene_type:complete
VTKESSEYKVVSVFLNCLLFFTIVAIAALSCSKINDKLNLKIERELNISIDLTPDTPE